VAFGNQSVGTTSKAQAVTLTNSGNAALAPSTKWEFSIWTSRPCPRAQRSR
jgi:hypothetical protein